MEKRLGDGVHVRHANAGRSAAEGTEQRSQAPQRAGGRHQLPRGRSPPPPQAVTGSEDAASGGAAAATDNEVAALREEVAELKALLEETMAVAALP